MIYISYTVIRLLRCYNIDMIYKPQILVVDDDQELCDLLQDFLNRHGYRVVIANHGRKMAELLSNTEIDLIVLDIMLPGEDGFELCKKIRTYSNVPIIMLSAMGEETDRIVGLEIGADDYLPKPFNPRELLARIKALLRRTRGDLGGEEKFSASKVYFAEWVLDINKRCLITKDSMSVPLSVGEYDLLLALLQHTGKTLSREQLLDLTTERDYLPFDRSIDVQIGRLRKKVEKNPKQPKLILTVRGGGYRFTAKVEMR